MQTCFTCAVLGMTFLSRFFHEFLRAPAIVGAATPSSAALARVMLEPIPFNKSINLVEFGPGTGVFTKVIRERLGPNDTYVGIEVNQNFVAGLHLDYPGMEFVNDSAENLEAILAARKISSVDAIVCSLPWALFAESLQDRIFAALRRCLKSEGVFVSFAYLQGFLLPGAWNLRLRLKQEFSSVKTSKTVWINHPPAFVYTCRR